MKLFAHRNHCCHNVKENVLKDTVAFGNMAIGIIFFTQTAIGVLGNYSLLYHYFFLYHAEYRLRSRDLIIKNLIIANSVVILSNGVPQTLTAFRLKHFFNDFGCKLLLYVQRVGRGVSIGTTCLLSVFQAITISPRNSRWKDLKIKTPKYIGYSVLFCWILFIAVHFIFPVNILVKWSSKNITEKRNFGYCSTLGREKILDALYVALFVFPEVLFSVLIILSSGSMIFILHRHKQRVRHIHRINGSSKSSPESRATQSILLLVTTFVSFYTLSSILHACLALFHNPSLWLVNTASLITVCFPTISPFILMNHDSAVFRLCFLWLRNTKFPDFIRNK
uniref:Vomeronasal type-1 receptor n=1 Tax=Microcebus ravelobensis TaxID=122231 RepID=A0A1P8NV82_MICRA|nr:vomeronasal 1 receptor VN1R-Mmur065 [Microcebus ravelobensis]APX52488.1 vomeronasal 1 receptor VN1R-Mmur065 [Microcebus ravelobensis]APX52489.1 vomeronasal 1 receptor VN1R-Mmur065 [Microcebus ravelobensis]APX52490.1 vomeronasal 1 receptor VN1R-Mmur065 [Microcebus ravelobensis]APX52491.1 vomeronasal 1 receptor VN1R-Mmur065 [Microcebus ravelobensis]